MKQDSALIANWLVSTAIVIGLLVVGRPLLVPFLFAVLLWTVFNAVTDRLKRLHFPAWLAWFSSLVLLAAALYLIARILGNEATAVANLGPGYVANLEALSAKWFAFLHLGPALSPNDLISRFDVAGIMEQTAGSVGGIFFQLILIATYVGFLLSEQRYLPAKFASLSVDGVRREEEKAVIRTIAHQVQTYLGVCTLLSSIMAGATFVILTLVGVDFAGFWALMMFLLTYIPFIGAVAVLLPSLMALLQFGSTSPFLIVAASLSAVHFLLTNLVQPVLLGRTLNLSSARYYSVADFLGTDLGCCGSFSGGPDHSGDRHRLRTY